MHFNVGFKTDVGRKRKQNQDNAVSAPELGLFVVADGMGGHQGGEIASAIVVDAMPQVVENSRKAQPWDPKIVLQKSIGLANELIHKKGHEQPHLQGMGTTTVAMLFDDGLLTVGHVGDSRCYVIRQSALWQVTRDHSLVQEKLRAGLINRAQLRTDKMKNVITRSVGYEPHVSVETYEMKTQPGDIFLICSDGLSGLMDDSEILGVVQKESSDLQKTAEALVALANENGGDDNVTAILVQV